MDTINIIERAFQLAAESISLKEVREKLHREGYVQVEAHLDGKHIKKQLNDRLIPDGRKRRVR